MHTVYRRLRQNSCVSMRSFCRGWLAYMAMLQTFLPLRNNPRTFLLSWCSLLVRQQLKSGTHYRVHSMYRLQTFWTVHDANTRCVTFSKHQMFTNRLHATGRSTPHNTPNARTTRCATRCPNLLFVMSYSNKTLQSAYEQCLNNPGPRTELGVYKHRLQTEGDMLGCSTYV